MVLFKLKKFKKASLKKLTIVRKRNSEKDRRRNEQEEERLTLKLKREEAENFHECIYIYSFIFKL